MDHTWERKEGVTAPSWLLQRCNESTACTRTCPVFVGGWCGCPTPGVLCISAQEGGAC